MWFKKRKNMTSEDKDRLDWLWKIREKHDRDVSLLLEKVRVLEYRLDFPPKHKIGDVIEEGTVVSMKIAMPVYDKEGNRLRADWDFEVLTKEGRKISVLK